MLKTLLIIGCTWIATSAWAASPIPSVNTDMGCTAAGQSIVYNGSAITCQAPQRPSVTVAGLPTCNSGAQGLMYFVTNALGPVALSAVVGGGAVAVGVTCNGTTWIVQ